MPHTNITGHLTPPSWLITCIIPCALLIACELEPKRGPQVMFSAPHSVNASSTPAHDAQLTSQHKTPVTRSLQPITSNQPSSHEHQPALDALDAIPELPEPSRADEDEAGSDEGVHEPSDGLDPTNDWGC